MNFADTAITYGENGIRCGCGKPAHSNLSPCDGPAATPMTDEQLDHVRATLHGHLGPDWTQDYIEGSVDESAYYRVATAEGTVVATVPDWAGSIAMFLVEANDYVPKLLDEIQRLRAENERLRAAQTTTVWSAYEEDGEGELYLDLATAQQGAIGLWGKVCRENEEEPNGVYTWAVMKNGGFELVDGRDHTSVYVAECKVHATPVDYTAVRECGCPARFERHNYDCKETTK